MAVDDFLSRDTDAFVLPSKSYYPLKIPIAHYQLRHFISSPEQDLIYYATGSDIYCLNAATRTQAHVTTLPWDARCTASGHGYVCVGGADQGNFAAIKVAGFPPSDPSDVDALLPLELESRSTVPRAPLLGAAHRIRLDKMGADIVNSISIHKFPAEGDGEDEVVAVLTNNDQTVRIYSLTQNLEIAVLRLPFAMNHATISPDGQMLVAVGDSHTGFFFERVKPSKPSNMKTSENRVESPYSEWQLFEEVGLYVPPNSHLEGYFTTAWSPSGRLCAVGSECGYITVFDIELLKRVEYGEDAIVQLISSTRPDTTIGPGAVRTMQFSPAPWDFLIWSEDQARVCVADLRSGLKIKQVVTLDPKEEDLEKVEIADFDLTLNPALQLAQEADFIRRYRRALDSESTDAAVTFATGYMEVTSDQRILHRQLGVVESDNAPYALTAHERQILGALRTARPREESREQGITPRSINYRTSEHLDTARERTAAGRRNIPETLNEFIESARQLNFLQRRTSQERTSQERASQERASQERTLQERTMARPQASIVFSIDEGTVNAPSTTNITDSATTRSPNPIPAYTRRVTNEIINSTDDAWRTIEEALTSNARAASAIAHANINRYPTSTSNVGSTAPELQSDIRHLRQLHQMRERLRNGRTNQPLDSYDIGMSYRRSSRSTHDPSQGVRTAGLAMSQDGRTLYCGTEEGIFEVRINLHERKGFPAITPR